MKANELRTGNLLLFRGMEFEVKDITSKYVTHQSELGIYFYNELVPIPLTKEWLLKFGFIANRYNDEFELYPLMFDCEYTDHGEWNISYDGHPLSTEIQHVHQLQNLYFALTGKELTLNSAI